jgi:hypothetical protein
LQIHPPPPTLSAAHPHDQPDQLIMTVPAS